MLVKKKNKQNLDALIPRYIDVGKNSPNFFNLTFMPEVLTAGKNVIKFRPYQNRFRATDPIQIEILDFNGDPIYYEILDYRDSDGSIVMSVYVYEDTPSGNCLITFIATALYDENLQLIPEKELYQYNFRYRTVSYVDSNRRNDSEIIYTTPPTISVKERKYSIVEQKFSGSRYISTTGTASYSLVDNRYRFTSGVGNFSKNFENGIFKISQLSSDYHPFVNYETASFSYTSSVVSVQTPNSLLVKDPLIIYGVGDKERLLTKIESQPYEVTYSAAPISRRLTQNNVSYAQVDITGLDPASGNVSRVKVFAKSTFKPESDYELIFDDEIKLKNNLVDTGSYVIEYPIGQFDESQTYTIPNVSGSFSVNPISYWNVTSYNAPSAQKLVVSSSLFGGLTVNPSSGLSGSSEIILTQTASILSTFYRDTDYRVKFDYSVQSHPSESRQPKIDVYVTGNAFVEDTPFGKYVGGIPSGSNSKTIDFDYELKLPINSDGTGRLLFIIRPGCTISNVRIVEDIQLGFTPNRVRLYVPSLQEHRNEYVDYKVQFFNYTLKEANKFAETFNAPFEGGNYYIYGGNNIITGSLFLSSFTSSGVEMVGDTFSVETRDLYTWGYNVEGQLGN